MSKNDEGLRSCSGLRRGDGATRGRHGALFLRDDRQLTRTVWPRCIDGAPMMGPRPELLMHAPARRV